MPTYGGMDVSDAKKLKALEAENAKLKKLLTESVMDVSTLKDMLGKNFWRPVRRETLWTGRSHTKANRSAGHVSCGPEVVALCVETSY